MVYTPNRGVAHFTRTNCRVCELYISIQLFKNANNMNISKDVVDFTTSDCANAPRPVKGSSVALTPPSLCPTHGRFDSRCVCRGRGLTSTPAELATPLKRASLNNSRNRQGGDRLEQGKETGRENKPARCLQATMSTF